MVQYEVKKKIYTLSESFSATPEVQLLHFKPLDGEPMRFDPGMFVMVYGLDGSDKQYIGRAFSVASEPDSSEMELLIVKEHDNRRSHFMDAKVGDKFYISGPYGQFKFDPEENDKALFIAGGTGLAPFLSTLRHIKKNNYNTDSVLMYSTKYPTEIILKDELESLEKQLNLKKVITVTRPSDEDGWDGEKGHICDTMISKYVPDLSERTIYICGPLGFVKGMKDALSLLNIDVKDPKKVKADVWG